MGGLLANYPWRRNETVVGRLPGETRQLWTAITAIRRLELTQEERRTLDEISPRVTETMVAVVHLMTPRSEFQGDLARFIALRNSLDDILMRRERSVIS